jgi:[ribosomal protein S5]-alanine N-acetyltransferase
MKLIDFILETNRLILKPITYEYLYDIYNEFTVEITKYMFPKPADEISETKNFIESSINGLINESNLQLVIINKNDDKFLGCLGVHNINTKTPELGIWIKKSAHKNGYGLEAITEIIKWSKKNWRFWKVSGAKTQYQAPRNGKVLPYGNALYS